MDYPCGIFGDCHFNCFGSVMHSNWLTHRQSRMNTLLQWLSQAWVNRVSKQQIVQVQIFHVYINKCQSKSTRSTYWLVVTWWQVRMCRVRIMTKSKSVNDKRFVAGKDFTMFPRGPNTLSVLCCFVWRQLHGCWSCVTSPASHILELATRCRKRRSVNRHRRNWKAPLRLW